MNKINSLHAVPFLFFPGNSRHGVRSGAGGKGNNSIEFPIPSRLPAPSEAGSDLRSCRVELVGRVEALGFIIPNEHLGTMGGSALFFGLRAPSDRLLSLVGFGHGPHGARTRCDVVLERGWTRPEAPRNAGSHLIGRALRYGRRYLGWTVVRAYSDPRFAEAGLLYRAVGFVPATTRHPNNWRWGLREGDKILSDRAIYRRFGSIPAARAAGAELVQLPLRVGWEWRAR